MILCTHLSYCFCLFWRERIHLLSFVFVSCLDYATLFQPLGKKRSNSKRIDNDNGKGELIVSAVCMLLTDSFPRSKCLICFSSMWQHQFPSSCEIQCNHTLNSKFLDNCKSGDDRIGRYLSSSCLINYRESRSRVVFIENFSILFRHVIQQLIIYHLPFIIFLNRDQ